TEMISIHNISIKNKLITMQVFISVVVLGLSTIAFIVTDIKGYKERRAKSMEAISEVLGSNVVSALHFSDNQTAERILADLSVAPAVLNAAILDENGEVFASYTKQGADDFQFFLSQVEDNSFEFIGDI